MKLSEFYDEISRRTDTDKTQINVAETKRCLAVMFDVLEDLKPAEAFDLIAKGLAAAGKRHR